MDFRMNDLTTRQRYKLLVSSITPRPIAWVTTCNTDGRLNAAPYSFFNAVGDDPPLVVLGLLHRPEDATQATDKDTTANIRATGEFVVNLVTETDVDRMTLSAAPAPPAISEIEYADLDTGPADDVAPPLITSSPVNYECRAVEMLDYAHQTVVIGEVLVMHIKDEFIADPERLHLATPEMHLVGRIHGPGNYVRTTDTFTVNRVTYKPERSSTHG